MSTRRKKWLVVSVVLALLVLFPLCLRWQAQRQLAAYRNKLIAGGEKLTISEVAPKENPAATNTAKLLRVAGALRFSGRLWDYEPAGMRAVKPGVARVAWKQEHCLEFLSNGKSAVDIWPGFAGAVQTNQDALEEMRALVEKGGVEFMEDFEHPFEANRMNNLAEVKTVVSELNARGVLALHQGQPEDALTWFRAGGKVTREIARNPLEIYQLVAYACDSIRTGGCWEALQAGGWTDEQLAQLQHQWEQMRLLEDAGTSLAVERARFRLTFDMARSSRKGFEDTFGLSFGLLSNDDIWQLFVVSPPKAFSALLTAYPRRWGWQWIWSYRDEQRSLEAMQSVMNVTREVQKGRNVLAELHEAIKPDAAAAPAAADYDVVAVMTGTTKRFLSRALRAQTVANMVITAVALERYRLAHHVYPGALSNVVPEFVKSVPIDCMDGQYLRYRLNPDGTFLLYSVGEDGVDNGGDPTPMKDRAMTFFNGRDLVWPRPATDEEVQAFEAEQNKPKPQMR